MSKVLNVETDQAVALVRVMVAQDDTTYDDVIIQCLVACDWNYDAAARMFRRLASGKAS